MRSYDRKVRKIYLMIISRTPFRISFAGGGTDFSDFYEVEEGSVLNAAINKYMYITVNKRFDESLRISYSKTEIVDSVAAIKHDLVRETLRFLGFEGGLEITSMADIPAQTGLGSSSSFTVGLLNALYAYRGQHVSAERLAREACHIEIDICREPIGKQDQIIAAYGGLQHIRFQPDGNFFVDPVICTSETKEKLAGSLLMFYTNRTRPAAAILTKQKEGISSKMEILSGLRNYSIQMKDILVRGEDLPEFGSILHQSWQLKKQMASGISDDEIDSYYARAQQAGALGGKILGAGGGGFILLYVEPRHQAAVRKILSDLKELAIQFEPQGSKIIYVGD